MNIFINLYDEKIILLEDCKKYYIINNNGEIIREYATEAQALKAIDKAGYIYY